jgi:hypothetical protein
MKESIKKTINTTLAKARSYPSHVNLKIEHNMNMDIIDDKNITEDKWYEFKAFRNKKREPNKASIIYKIF